MRPGAAFRAVGALALTLGALAAVAADVRPGAGSVEPAGAAPGITVHGLAGDATVVARTDLLSAASAERLLKARARVGFAGLVAAAAVPAALAVLLAPACAGRAPTAWRRWSVAGRAPPAPRLA